MTETEALQFMLKKYGTQTNIAEAAGVSQAAVSGWYCRARLPRKQWKLLGDGSDLSIAADIGKPAYAINHGISSNDLTLGDAKRLYAELKEIFG